MSGKVKLALDLEVEVKEKLVKIARLQGKTQTEVITKLIEDEYRRIKAGQGGE